MNVALGWEYTPYNVHGIHQEQRKCTCTKDEEYLRSINRKGNPFTIEYHSSCFTPKHRVFSIEYSTFCTAMHAVQVSKQKETAEKKQDKQITAFNAESNSFLPNGHCKILVWWGHRRPMRNPKQELQVYITRLRGYRCRDERERRFQNKDIQIHKSIKSRFQSARIRVAQRRLVQFSPRVCKMCR